MLISAKGKAYDVTEFLPGMLRARFALCERLC